MSFKSKSGFTLIEVLLALSIVAMVLTPLLIMQGGALRSTGLRSRVYDRFSAAYSFLMSTVFVPDQIKNSSQNTQDPRKALRLTTRAIDSGILKDIPQLQLHTVTFSVQDRRIKKAEKLSAITFNQEVTQE